jgi:hypothetical protein
MSDKRIQANPENSQAKGDVTGTLSIDGTKKGLDVAGIDGFALPPFDYFALVLSVGDTVETF